MGGFSVMQRGSCTRSRCSVSLAFCWSLEYAEDCWPLLSTDGSRERCVFSESPAAPPIATVDVIAVLGLFGVLLVAGICGGLLAVVVYTDSSDSSVASAAASIATGWSEPVPGRELHPLESSAFHGALLRHQSGRFGCKMASDMAVPVTQRTP